MKCDICGLEEAEWICHLCDNKMVCSDCDLKWHQHPRRRSHKRELLKSPQTKLVNGVSTGLPSSGSFIRTSAPSKSMEDLPASECTTVRKSPMQNRELASVAGTNDRLMLLAGNEPLVGESSTLQRTDVHVLPKSVAEINEDLCLQSLCGVNSSLIAERNPSGQTARENHSKPDVVQRSDSRQFSSLTSDFQTMLNNLQSMTMEVSNSVMSGSESRGLDTENWNFAPSANQHTEDRRSPTNDSSPAGTKFMSDQSVVRNADDDVELARLWAETKYPPSIGPSVSPVPTASGEHTKTADSQQASASIGQLADSNSSVLHDFNTTVKSRRTIDSGDSSVQRTGNIPPTSYDLPRPGVQTTLSEQKDACAGTLDNSAKSGGPTKQSAFDRQRSETLMKQSLEDSPGVVCSRVGDGKDLGVLERSGVESEPAYQSKFTDIHDEVR